jgi:hypothetical protein
LLAPAHAAGDHQTQWMKRNRCQWRGRIKQGWQGEQPAVPCWHLQVSTTTCQHSG